MDSIIQLINSRGTTDPNFEGFCQEIQAIETEMAGKQIGYGRTQVQGFIKRIVSALINKTQSPSQSTSIETPVDLSKTDLSATNGNIPATQQTNTTVVTPDDRITAVELKLDQLIKTLEDKKRPTSNSGRPRFNRNRNGNQDTRQRHESNGQQEGRNNWKNERRNSQSRGFQMRQMRGSNYPPWMPNFYPPVQYIPIQYNKPQPQPPFLPFMPNYQINQQPNHPPQMTSH